jgi:arginase family enzyme
MDIDDHGVEWIAEKIKARIGDGPVVISLDVDVMDPAYLPASELRVLVPAGRHADEQPERPSLADGPLES